MADKRVTRTMTLTYDCPDHATGRDWEERLASVVNDDELRFAYEIRNVAMMSGPIPSVEGLVEPR